MAKKKKQAEKPVLSDRALLVSMTISQWSARKVDYTATNEVHDKFKSESGSGNFHKALLPASTEQGAISAIASQARKYFYDQTLPWFNDGTRIISGDHYLEFSAKTRALKADFNSAVTLFEKAFPRLKKEAKRSLGLLYNDDEYPDINDLSKRYRIDVSFLPMADVKDFRLKISDVELKEFEDRILEVQQKGVQECWNRLHEVVKKASDSLARKEGSFRDSLIENITEVVDLLPKLNITKDKNLEKSRKEISDIVANIDGKAREEAQKDLQKAISKMGSFMGKKI